MLQYVRPPNRAESCVSWKRVLRWRTTVRAVGAWKQTRSGPEEARPPLPRNSVPLPLFRGGGRPTRRHRRRLPALRPARGRSLYRRLRPANRLPRRDRRRRRRGLGFPHTSPAFPLRGGAYGALGGFAESERHRPFEPCGPVMSTRNPPREGSAAIKASNGCAKRWPAVVAVFGADSSAALAFPSAAHRNDPRPPSGLRRRFFPAAAHAPARGGTCDALGRFAERDRDRLFEALSPRDENQDAAPERVRGDPGFERLSEALAGGGHGRLYALPAGGGDSRGARLPRAHPAPDGSPLPRSRLGANHAPESGNPAHFPSGA